MFCLSVAKYEEVVDVDEDDASLLNAVDELLTYKDACSAPAPESAVQAPRGTLREG